MRIHALSRQPGCRAAPSACLRPNPSDPKNPKRGDAPARGLFLHHDQHGHLADQDHGAELGVRGVCQRNIRADEPDGFDGKTRRGHLRPRASGVFDHAVIQFRKTRHFVLGAGREQTCDPIPVPVGLRGVQLADHVFDGGPVRGFVRPGHAGGHQQQAYQDSHTPGYAASLDFLACQGA